MRHILLGVLFLFSVKGMAHDEFPGFNHIVGGDCSVKKDPLQRSFVFSTKKQAPDDVFVYQGTRNPVDSRFHLIGKGKADVVRLMAFPVNESETLRLSFDKALTSVLGRTQLAIAAKVLNPDTDHPGSGFLASPMNDEEDVEISCQLQFEPTEDPFNTLHPELKKSNHPSICALEYYEPIDKKWLLACTGSVVSSTHLLTAGHCFDLFRKYQTRVRCGDPADSQSYFQIKNWVSNPEHHPGGKGTDNSQDSSVIEVERDFHRPVLPVEFDIVRAQTLLKTPGRCTHYGMGQRQDGSVGVLYQISFQFPPVELGGEEFVRRAFNDINMIASDPRRFLRPGDSGGPIVCQDQGGQEKIVGLHVMNVVSSTAALSSLPSLMKNFISPYVQGN